MNDDNLKIKRPQKLPTIKKVKKVINPIKVDSKKYNEQTSLDNKILTRVFEPDKPKITEAQSPSIQSNSPLEIQSIRPSVQVKFIMTNSVVKPKSSWKPQASRNIYIGSLLQK